MPFPHPPRFAPKEFAAIECSPGAPKRSGEQHARPDHLTAASPTRWALWRDAYLESLASRNYAEALIEGRTFDLKFFLLWAEERDLKTGSK